MKARAPRMTAVAFLLLLPVVGCTGKRDVTLEVTREVVLQEPTIGSLTLEPSGTLDTRERGAVVKVTLQGDPGLEATFDVTGRLNGQPMVERTPGVYEGSFDVQQGETGTLGVTAWLKHRPSGATASSTREAALTLVRTEARCDAATARAFDAQLQDLHVHFALGKQTLSDEAKSVIAAKREVLTDPRFEVCPIHINGHADERGSPELNQSLSRWRAQEVAWYLRELGVSNSRLVIHFYGASRPAAEGVDEKAYALNRRVEVHGVETVN